LPQIEDRTASFSWKNYRHHNRRKVMTLDAHELSPALGADPGFPVDAVTPLYQPPGSDDCETISDDFVMTTVNKS